MEIKEHFSKVENIISEKTATTEYASKEVTNLFELLHKEYSPDPEIEKAKIFVLNWTEQVKADSEERSKNTDAYLGEIDNFLAEIKADLKEDRKRIKKGLGPTDKSFEDWEPKSNLEAITDFSKLDKLTAQLGIVMKFDLFAKKASKYINMSRLKFKYFTIISSLSKAILILLTIVASYYIGKACEIVFKIDPLYVAIIAAIIGIYTSDKWFGKLKDKIFWTFASKQFNHSSKIFNDFLKLKIAFYAFVQEYIKGNN